MKSKRCIAGTLGLLAALASQGIHAADEPYRDLPFLETDIDYCKVDNDMIRERIGRYLEGKSDGSERMARFYGGYNPAEADRAKRTCIAYNLGMEAIRNQYHDKLVFEFCEEGTTECVKMGNGLWLRSIANADRP